MKGKVFVFVRSPGIIFRLRQELKKSLMCLSCVLQVSLKDPFGVSQGSLSSLFFSTLRIIHQNFGAENTLSCIKCPGPHRRSPQHPRLVPGPGSFVAGYRRPPRSPPTHAQLWPGSAPPPPLRKLIARTQNYIQQLISEVY